uniref:hypothetical protein n=1 Tax=Microbulbifer agarilyticus TaxID=260552 RepID=UPI000255BBFE|nr:hypothetical protein [Microbulbifer agarilyticus]
MTRKLLLTALATTLAASVALHGCSRKSDTNDPDTAPKTEAEVVEEVTVTEPDATTTPPTADGTGDTSTGNASTDSPESPNSEGQLICNAKWFEWVNTEVMNTQGLAIAEHYPSGLPEVGSKEWFTAMDKLTGGDGAHGPDGGSDEWCFMMQQRLSNND